MILALLLLLPAIPFSGAQSAGPTLAAQERPFGTLREQADIQQEWLALRLERVLPRRRTIYVFCDQGPDKEFRRIAIGGTSQGGLYEVVREAGAQVVPDGRGRMPEPYGPDQWQILTPIVEECDPQTIQVNISYNMAFSDGINAGEWEQMKVALGPVYRKRVVHRELLPLQYIEERLPEMLPVYKDMMRWAHETIATAFSSPVILRGDLLHTDFGILALGLTTDTQHMGYVLREGETDAPEGLKEALRRSNRFQDILLEEMIPGRTGNQVLAIGP